MVSFAAKRFYNQKLYYSAISGEFKIEKKVAENKKIIKLLCIISLGYQKGDDYVQ
jgi:hypothetical protein